MTKYEELLAQAAQVQTQPTVSPFSISDAKKSEVTSAAVEKKRALSGSSFTEDTARRLATTQKTGYGVGQLTQEEEDYLTLPLDALVTKYGPDAAQKLLDISNQRNQVERNASSYRDPLTTASDVVTKVGSSFASTIGGIGAWGAGLVSDEVGTGIASGVDRFNQLVEESLSPQLRAAKGYNESVRQLAQKDNALKAEQEAATYVNPEARQQVRDFVDAFAITGANPIALSDSLAQAGGSLLAVPPIAKGLSAIGRTALSKATQGRLAITAATNPTAYNGAVSMLANAASKASVPLSIGLMEGGGAYTDTVNEIMGMSEKDLLSSSPEYVKLRENNLTHEEAKIQLAASAGNKAALIQAPVGMLTGGLVNKFEGNPLKFVAPRKALGNMSREATEESLQGMSAEAAKNYAINTEVDPARSLLENVGWAGGESGIAGLGIAGVTSTPSLVGSAGKAVSNQVLSSFDKIVSIGEERVKSLKEQNNPVSVTNVNKLNENLAANSDTAVTAMEEVKKAVTPELAAKLDLVIQTIASVSGFDPEDYAGYSESIRTRLAAAKNKTQELDILRSIAEDKNASDEDRQAAGLKLLDEMDGFDSFKASTADVIDAIPKDSPAFSFMKDIGRISEGLSSTPAFQKTMASLAERLAKKQSGTSVNTALADPTSVEGVAAIKETVALARLDPASVNKEAVKQILAHNTAGTITLSKKEEAYLKVADAILTNFKDSNQNNLATINMKEVSEEAVEDNTGTNRGHSAIGYAQRIANLIGKGDLESAKNLLSRFGEFAQHFQNKGNALNTASTISDGSSRVVVFDALQPDGTWKSEGGQVKLFNNDAGISFATRVLREAGAITNMYNALTEAFPELGQTSLAPFKASDFFLKDGTVSEETTKKSLNKQYYELKVKEKTGQKPEPKKAEEKPAESKKEEAPAEPAEKPVEASKSEADTSTSPKEETPPEPSSVGSYESPASFDEVFNNTLVEVAEQIVSEKDGLEKLKAALGKTKPLYRALKGMLLPEEVKKYFKGNKSVNFFRSKNGGTLVDLIESGALDDFLTAAEKENATEAAESLARRILSNDPTKWFTLSQQEEYEKYSSQISNLEDVQDEQLQELINLVFQRSVDEARAKRERKSAGATKPNTSKASSTTADAGTTEKKTDTGSKPVTKPVVSPTVAEVKKQIALIADAYKDYRAVYDKKDKTDADKATAKALNTKVKQLTNELAAYVAKNTFTFENSQEEIDFLSDLPPKALLAMEGGYARLIELKRADKNTPFTTSIGGFTKVLNFAGNIFQKATKFVENTLKQNKLISNQTPVEKLRSLITEKYSEYFTVGDTVVARDNDAANAYLDYVEKRVNLIKDLLKEKVNSKLVDKDGNPTELLVGLMQVQAKDALRAVKKLPTHFKENRILSLLTDSGKPIPELNDQILELAALAYLHWEMKANDNNELVDDKKLARIFGLPEELSFMAYQHRVAASTMRTKLEVQSGFPDYIFKFLSLEKNPDSPTGHHDGVVRSLGMEIIHSLSQLEKKNEDDMNTVDTYEAVIKDASGKQIRSVVFYRFPELTAAVKRGREILGDAIHDAAFEEQDSPIYVGESIPPVSNTVLRSHKQPLTQQQEAAMNKVQSTKHFFDTLSFDLYAAIGIDGMKLIKGVLYKDETLINKKHAETVEGQVVAIHSTYSAIARIHAKAQEAADIAGVPIDQIPVRFKHEFTSVGRLQMVGSDNPQANKALRHMLLPTRDTIDLSNPNMLFYFQLAVAQMIGIKVHNLSTSQILAELNAKMDNPDFKKARATLLNWSANPKQAMTTEQLMAIKEAVNPKNIPNAPFGGDAIMYALLEYARMEAASPDERKAFVTSVYLEADGVTNGPAGATYMLGFGSLGKDPTQTVMQWMTTMRKVGVFFSKEDRTGNTETLNEERQKDPVDFYQAVGLAIPNAMTRLFKKAVDTEKEVDLVDRNKLLRVLNVLSGGDIDLTVHPDFSVFGSVKRSITKNPSTTAVYGSGARSTTVNLVNDALGYLYAKLTEANVSYNESAAPNKNLLNHFAIALFGSDTDENVQKTLAFTKDFSDVVGGFNWNTDFAKMQLSATNHSNFVDSALLTFGEPLRNAIRKVTGNTLPFAMVIAQATNFITESAAIDFNTLLEEKYAQRAKSDPKFQRADGLSLNDVREIERIIAKKYPILKTEYQSFDPSGSAVETDESKQIGSTLDGNITVFPTVKKMTGSGVSGTPYLVIGLGDGLMMQIIAADPTGPAQDLLVFDGAHMKVSDIVTHSVKYNKAIWEAWQSNPANIIVPSFLAALRSSPIKQAEGISDLATELLYGAARIDAIHTVLKQYQISIDQMAAGMQGYLHNESGFLFDPSNSQDVAALSKAIATELDRSNKSVNTVINSFSNDTSNRNTVTNSTVRDYLANYNSSDPTIQKLVIALMTVAGKVPIVFLETETTENGNNAEFDGKTIYIAKSKDASRNELALHESVHAATFALVSAYYEGKAPELKPYVTRLEELMGTFLNKTKDLNAIPKEDRSSFNSAITAINAYLNNNDPAAALNEFMAWSLANANIRKQLKSKKSVFSEIARHAKAYIFKLLGVKDIVVPKNMYDDIVFNTISLIQEAVNPIPTVKENLLAHSTRRMADERLEKVNHTFTKILGRFYKKNPTIAAGGSTPELDSAIYNTVQVKSLISSILPNLSQDELDTIGTIVTTLSTGAEIDSGIMLTYGKLYNHFIKDLVASDLYPEGTDPTNIHPQVATDANNLFNLLVGEYSTGKDYYGRSMLLPIFAALTLTNDSVRKVVAKKGLPDKSKINTATVDDAMRSFADAALDKLAVSLDKSKNASNMLQAIDRLFNAIAEQTEEQISFTEIVSNKTGSVLDGVENKVDAGINYLASKLTSAGKSLNKSSNSVIAKSGNFVSLAGTVLDSKTAPIAVEGILSAASISDKAKAFRELIVDVIGRTEANKNIYDLVKRVRTKIQQHRQEYREHLPHILVSKFKTNLNKQDWTTLYNGLSKTDIAHLADILGVDVALSLLTNPADIASRISTLESDLRVGHKNWPGLQAKMQQLAHYMNTGEPGSMLMRNALAISKAFGGNQNKIDSLVSLYALSNLDKITKDKLSSLVQSDFEGMHTITSYLVSLKKLEENQTEDIAINMYKGYLPALPSAKKHLIVINDKDADKYLEQGYVRLKDYTGLGSSNKGYYFLDAPFRAAFSQGIMQNIHTTAGGIDVRTKLTISGTGGAILDPQAVSSMLKRISLEKGNIETLLPVFNADGSVRAFERSLDPAMLEKTDRDTNLAKMVGVQAGRKIEESLAEEANMALVDAAYDMYEKAYKADPAKASREFVDLFQTNDPVYKDALKLMPPKIKDLIKNKFPGQTFMVHRSMINTAIGYRTPSIGDAWTGVSNLSPDTQNKIKYVLVSIFGANAYKYAVNAESILQNVVSEAKLIIVVKSIIVPLSNMASNVLQLMSQGVPIDYIVKSVPKLLNETQYYTKQRVKQIELNAELLAAGSDTIKRRKIQTQIDTINDEFRRLSIWPLIAAGEFTAISDIGIGREEIMLTEGKFNNYMENLVDKLPSGAKTFGKYAVISKDTALFQGLQKSVEYGDFFAKAISYQYKLKEGVSSEEALGQITEQFVNYDMLSGRFREGGENIGLWWFTAFKIRSIKTAMSMMRNNPVRTLLMGMMPLPDIGQGSPVEDNAISKLLQGNLGYSIGWNQLFAAPGLHPVGNLLH